jgi:hypothetical protein
MLATLNFPLQQLRKKGQAHRSPKNPGQQKITISLCAGIPLTTTVEVTPVYKCFFQPGFTLKNKKLSGSGGRFFVQMPPGFFSATFSVTIA